MLDLDRNIHHRRPMSNHPWDVDASVFLYPPLGSDDADPQVLFQGTVRACFDMAAKLPPEVRTNVEIETDDSSALYNSVQVESLIEAGEHLQEGNRGK